jgi:hypothetical protein
MAPFDRILTSEGGAMVPPGMLIGRTSKREGMCIEEFIGQMRNASQQAISQRPSIAWSSKPARKRIEPGGHVDHTGVRSQVTIQFPSPALACLQFFSRTKEYRFAVYKATFSSFMDGYG